MQGEHEHEQEHDNANAMEEEQGGEGEGVEVELSEEESAAVTRLQAMFPHIPQMMIVQTFTAVGKDEALCANLLMDGGGFND